MGKKWVLFCPSGTKMGMILPKEAEMPPEIIRKNRCSGVFHGHFSGNNSIIQRIMDFQLFCKFFFKKNKKWTKILSKKNLPDTFLVSVNTRFLFDTKNYRTIIEYYRNRMPTLAKFVITNVKPLNSVIYSRITIVNL